MSNIKINTIADLSGNNQVSIAELFNLPRALSDYSALKQYSGAATTVVITQQGIAGLFFTKSSTASDNGGTIIVANDGRRWFRVFDQNPCPEWFGAKGDGSTDDTVALTKHLASGLSMYLGDKTYVISAGLVVGAQYQSVFGSSMRSTVKALAGTYDIFTFTNNGSGCGIDTMRIDAALMTGGYTIVVDGSNVCTIANIRGANGWNGIKVRKANTTTIMNSQMAYYRGTDLFLGDGTTERSDLLKIYGLTLSSTEAVARNLRPRGFTIDGNFNSIQAFALLVLQARTGINHINSASTTRGGFGRYYDAEVEYVNEDVVRIESGEDIHFTDCYMHGSFTGAGMWIADGVGNVSVKGGKISGNWTYGMYNAGGKVRAIGVNIGGNSLQSVGGYSAVFCDSTAKSFNAVGCDTGLNSGVDSGTSRHKYGFEVAANAVDCNWSGGSLKNNTTGEWKDNSGKGQGNVNVTGYSGTTPDSDNQYSAIVPTDGGTFQMLDNAPTVALNPAAALAAFTLNLPINPKDGMKVMVGTKLAITSFTLVGGQVGHVVNSKPTTLANGQGFGYIWRASSNNWFRLY